jgi:hypothetical protein
MNWKYMFMAKQYRSTYKVRHSIASLCNQGDSCGNNTVATICNGIIIQSNSI